MAQHFFRYYGWAMSVFVWSLLGFFVIIATPPSNLLLAAYASFSIWGLLGFMFGLKNPKDGAPTTHLQLIAEWLTKLLLGAGLVELKSISEMVWKLSLELGGNDTSAALGYLFVFIAASAIGMIFGYLWSQIHYGSMLSNDDIGQDGTKEELGFLSERLTEIEARIS